jgi:hypothetical protein
MKSVDITHFRLKYYYHITKGTKYQWVQFAIN